MFKPKRLLFLIPVVVLLIAIPGFIAWATLVPPAMPQALDKMQSSAAVEVTHDTWLTFAPKDSAPDTGLIFYPGGRVVAEAYAPLAYDLAEAGYFVVIVPMPLNLAVFGVNSASDVMVAYPNIENWALGGHSLGGAMAASFAASNFVASNFAAATPDVIDGLVLMASYPQASDTLAAHKNLVVASIYGTLDGLATPDKIAESKAYLPDDALFVEIEGGNHAGFGWYGDQAGDNPATITREAQQQQVFAATLAVLEQIDQ